MSKNVIFCYSGSGNCLDIAKNIAKKLGDTDIVLMRSAPAVTDVQEAKKVGFVFPCYAGGLPGDVEEYVKRIKVSPKAYTFGIVSYAGYPGIGLSCWRRDGAEAEKMTRHIQALRQDGLDGFTVFAFDGRAKETFPLLREGPAALR